jgi:O-antigen/teichoic acid export membrane protein
MIKLIKKIFALGLGMFIGLIFEYIYIVYTAHSLTIKDFAILNIVLSISWITLTLISAGIEKSISKHLAETKNKSKLIMNGISVQALIGLFAMIIITIIGFVLNSELTMPLIIVGFTVFLMSIISAMFGALQGLKKMYSMSVYTTIQTVLKTGIAVLLMVLGFALFGALISFIFASLILIIILAIQLRKHIKKTKLDIKLIKKILTFSLPYATIIILFTIMTRIDLVILKLFSVNYETIGIYSGISALARGIFNLGTAVPIVLIPYIASKEKLNIKQFFKFLAYLLLAINILVYILAKFIIKLLYPDNFLQLWNYLPTLCITMSFFALALIIATILITKNYLKEALIPAIIVFITFVISSIVLTYYLASIGIVIAMLLNSILLYLIYVIKEKRKIFT